MPALLELNKLSKSFGAIVVASDLDLSIEQGQAIGIIGPNGAGKTTTIGILTGLVNKPSGNAKILG